MICYSHEGGWYRRQAKLGDLLGMDTAPFSAHSHNLLVVDGFLGSSRCTLACMVTSLHHVVEFSPNI